MLFDKESTKINIMNKNMFQFLLAKFFCLYYSKNIK